MLPAEMIAAIKRDHLTGNRARREQKPDSGIELIGIGRALQRLLRHHLLKHLITLPRCHQCRPRSDGIDPHRRGEIKRLCLSQIPQPGLGNRIAQIMLVRAQHLRIDDIDNEDFFDALSQDDIDTIEDVLGNPTDNLLEQTAEQYYAMRAELAYGI